MQVDVSDPQIEENEENDELPELETDSDNEFNSFFRTQEFKYSEHFDMNKFQYFEMCFGESKTENPIDKLCDLFFGPFIQSKKLFIKVIKEHLNLQDAMQYKFKTVEAHEGLKNNASNIIRMYKNNDQGMMDGVGFSIYCCPGFDEDLVDLNITTYDNGVENGMHWHYATNGKLQVDYNMKNGHLFQTFCANGNVDREFLDEKDHSICTRWEEDHSKIMYISRCEFSSVSNKWVANETLIDPCGATGMDLSYIKMMMVKRREAKVSRLSFLL